MQLKRTYRDEETTATLECRLIWTVSSKPGEHLTYLTLHLADCAAPTRPQCEASNETGHLTKRYAQSRK
jgi:hypothetical protein